MRNLNERHPDRWKLGKQVILLPKPTSNPVSITIGPDIEFPEPDWAANQMRTLAERGITHVIDIRIEMNDEDDFLDYWEEHWPDKPIRYIHIPMDDDGKTVDTEVWHTVRNIAQSIAASGQEAHFYIHCHMGVNRGPSFAMALAYEYVWQSNGAEGFSGLSDLLSSREDAAAIYFPQYLDWAKAKARNIDTSQALRMIEERRKNLSSVIHQKRIEEK